MKKKNIISFFITILTFINVSILIYYIINLNNIENILRYLGSIFLVLLSLFLICLLWIYSNKKKRSKKRITLFIITVIISLLFNIGFAFANYNFYIFNKTINKITSKLESISVSLVSLKENNNIKTIKNEKIAIIKKDTSPNINKLSIDLINDFKYNNDKIEYDDFYRIADDLKNGKIKYAILPSNYLDIYAVYDEYVDFSKNLKINLTKEETQEIKDETVTKNIDEPFSILLMGVDTLSSSYNADTLLVITFNPKTLTATMLSIPRDTYTTLSNGAKHKINASGWGGDRSVVKTVSNYLGINIDYYFKINFTGAVDLVNAIGGIDVVVPYSFCEQDSHRDWGNNTVFVLKGLQHLNGEQALALSRNRHSPDNSSSMKKYCPTYNEGIRNDFVRGQNQQLVFKAMLNSIKKIDKLETLYNLLDALGKNISTNMSRDTILSFYNLGMNILNQIDGIDLSDAITIQKLFFTSYIQTIRISNMDLSTVGHYGGSYDAIVKAMKENLGLKNKETIKTFTFNINNPYKENIIGSNIYTNKNAPILMDNYVGKDISTLEKWANNNNYALNKEYKEISDNSYKNDQIISHSPMRYVDLNTLREKKIDVVIAKSTTSSIFSYKTCLEEENKDNEKCILGDYTNQSIASFRLFINQTGLNLNIKYTEQDGTNDKIISQSIKNKSFYDIINNNTIIEITYTNEIKINNEEANKDNEENKINNENND